MQLLADDLSPFIAEQQKYASTRTSIAAARGELDKLLRAAASEPLPNAQGAANNHPGSTASASTGNAQTPSGTAVSGAGGIASRHVGERSSLPAIGTVRTGGKRVTINGDGAAPPSDPPSPPGQLPTALSHQPGASPNQQGQALPPVHKVRSNSADRVRGRSSTVGGGSSLETMSPGRLVAPSKRTPALLPRVPVPTSKRQEGKAVTVPTRSSDSQQRISEPSGAKSLATATSCPDAFSEPNTKPGSLRVGQQTAGGAAVQLPRISAGTASGLPAGRKGSTSGISAAGIVHTSSNAVPAKAQAEDSNHMLMVQLRNEVELQVGWLLHLLLCC